jgi:hypothetical protein
MKITLIIASLTAAATVALAMEDKPTDSVALAKQVVEKRNARFVT